LLVGCLQPNEINMQLSDQAIREFQQLYERDTGVRLSDLEAVRLANDLFNALEALLTYEDKQCNN
jgi:hypothetical protein